MNNTIRKLERQARLDNILAVFTYIGVALFTIITTPIWWLITFPSTGIRIREAFETLKVHLLNRTRADIDKRFRGVSLPERCRILAAEYYAKKKPAKGLRKKYQEYYNKVLSAGLDRYFDKQRHAGKWGITRELCVEETTERFCKLRREETQRIYHDTAWFLDPTIPTSSIRTLLSACSLKYTDPGFCAPATFWINILIFVLICTYGIVTGKIIWLPLYLICFPILRNAIRAIAFKEFETLARGGGAIGSLDIVPMKSNPNKWDILTVEPIYRLHNKTIRLPYDEEKEEKVTLFTWFFPMVSFSCKINPAAKLTTGDYIALTPLTEILAFAFFVIPAITGLPVEVFCTSGAIVGLIWTLCIILRRLPYMRVIAILDHQYQCIFRNLMQECMDRNAAAGQSSSAPSGEQYSGEFYDQFVSCKTIFGARKLYHQLCKEYHPDNCGNTPENNQRFNDLRQQYEGYKTSLRK